MTRSQPANRRRFLFGLVWIVLILALWQHERSAFAHYAGVKDQFETVAEGQSEASVYSRLGKPSYHEGRCGTIARISTGCQVEFVYGHPFSPLTADYFIVEFNGDHEVIATRHWVSP
ncbi:hypothetical protein SAMN05421770_107164 [Granulicella rosea]|uniref:Uncharacterized protein n=1 Tax=Granulicella rosea TaxID=474952 RepID=A0A239LQ59_9BACT|nr:hypothetical protein [Granulicella rosea]SNT32008.1 hypothetical protein SAMN05421770_107164 [Granulicella rosea]